MSILKLYQGFHNEESYKEAALTSSSSVIKISQIGRASCRERV